MNENLAALRKDAERWRKLRAMAWYKSSPMCVVMNPKDAVKVGHSCPSGQRLDDAIDAIKKETDDGNPNEL